MPEDSADWIRVLHVDDDPSLADLAATYIEREDERFVIETATSADEGLDLLRDDEFDCIISDYDMPGLTGIEFLQRVREDHPDLPFILYTGKGSEEVASEAISAGVSDYLQKERGTDQYTVLANRITNLVSQYRAVATVEAYASHREESEQYRQQLLETVSDTALSEPEKINRLLELGCDRYGVENGHLVMIDEETNRHEVVNASGSEIVREGVTDLSTTYCRKTVQSDSVLDVYHADKQGWEGDPAYDAFGLECYIGGKLATDDRLFGTLCFVDSNPREPFTHNEKAFFDQLRQWFTHMLDRRRRLNQAETVFEHTQDALFLIDVTDEQTFTIQSVNQAYEELTGYATADLRGQTPRDLLGDDQGGDVEAHFRECIENRDPIEYDEQLTLSDTTKYWHTRLAPVSEDGRVVQLVGATRDITDQRQRQRRYEAVFNQTYQFTGLLEPDGTLVEANETALEFGGLDRDDVIGKKLWETYFFQHSEATRARAQRAVDRAADGEFVRHELPVQGADREAIVDFSVRPVTDEEATVTLLIPEGRDITERKAREDRLRALNERIHRLVGADTREHISEIGVEAASEVLGLDANAIHLHDDQAGLVPVAGTDAIYDLIGDLPTLTEGDSIAWRVYDNGETLSLDDVHDDPDIYNPDTRVKSELYLPLGEYGILIAGSKTAAAFDQHDVVFGEILADSLTAALEHVEQTDQLRAREQELAETNTLLSTLFDTLPVGVTVLDTDGTITRANQRAEDVLGLTKSAIIGRPYDDPAWRIIDEDGEPIPVEDLPFARVIDTGETVLDYEHGIRWPDGSERWLSINATPLTTSDGAVEQVVAVITDITDQRTQEHALKQQNEQLDQFASIVSHDLRNPLNVADGRLALAQHECDSDHLDDVGRALERMTVLIDDILALAREGRHVDAVEPVALGDLTERCWRNVATAEATLTTDTDRRIQADRSRLQQLLENLMRNAVEHGGKDVTVTIGALDNGFYVEDDGPGIPDDERADVFAAGYATADGTGFGLSIVKQVAEAHGWDIRVTDGAETGARFEITDVEATAS